MFRHLRTVYIPANKMKYTNEMLAKDLLDNEWYWMLKRFTVDVLVIDLDHNEYLA